jgi:hypothetical protein
MGIRCETRISVGLLNTAVSPEKLWGRTTEQIKPLSLDPLCKTALHVQGRPTEARYSGIDR